MSKQFPTRPLGQLRRYLAFVTGPFAPFAVLGLALSALVACGTLPPAPLAGADPADPVAPVRDTRYQGTVGRFASPRPVEAAPWLEQNRRITPEEKP